MSTYFNIEDSVYIDNSGNMGIGITNPDKKLEVDGDISFGNSTISGHMIPDADDAYDIGSADYKIRDLYVSDNSMWVGDSHKISISGGKMKFRKRKTSSVPASIIAAGGDENGAIGNSAGINSLEDMKLKHWKAYMRTLANQSGATIQDIFTDNAEDYIEDSGSYNWLESGTKTFLTSGNVGIGTQDPAALLTLHYDPEASVGLKELLRLSWHDINYDTLRGDGTKISFHTSNVNQYPGTVEAGYFGVMKANAVEANTESDITIANNDGTNMVERIRILSDGKVGIGDFTSVLPGYKLDVVGDINLTGSIYINDQAQTFASSLTVKESDGSPSISSVDTIEFDQDSGFIVTNPSSGTAKIALGSHWKELYVNGQTTLSPSGQESLELIAGSNVTITTNDSSSPQAVTFASTDTNTQLTQEQVEDYVNGLIVAGSNITKTYDDSAGTLTIASEDNIWSESGSVASYTGQVKIEHDSSDSKWIFQPNESYIGLSKSGSGNFDFMFGVLNDSYLESYLSIGGGLIKFNCNGNSWFNGGNVGIGTNDPQTQLHIYDDSAEVKLTLQSDSGGASIYLDRQANTNQSVIFFRTNGSDDWIIGSDNSPTANVNDFSIKTTNNGTPEFVIDTSGNVGIGTSSPGYKLDVVGDINLTGDLRQNGSIVSFGGGSSVWSESGSEASYMGYVGIGIADPSHKLHIYGTSGDNDTEPVGILLESSNADGEPGIHFKNGTTSNNLFSIGINGSVGCLGFFYGDDNGGTQQGGNTLMTLNSSGNLGIGTTEPNCELNIVGAKNGEVRLEVENETDGTASKITIRAQGIGGNIGIQRFNASYTTSGAEIADGCLLSTGTGDSGGLGIRARASTGEIMLYTAGDNERMRIDADGNVGIGTDSPGQKLDVRGDVIFGTTGNSHNWALKSTAAHTKIFSHSDGVSYYQTQGDAYFGANSIGIITKPHLYINTSGNVGIGTTTPDYKLDVSGDGRFIDNIIFGSANNEKFIIHPRSQNGGDFMTICPDTSDGSGWEWGKNLCLARDGNVGIGTTDPGYKLDVSGDINLTGNLRRSSFETGFLVGGHGHIEGSNGNNSSYYTNPIYTIGPGYMPTETSLSNMYGIGYTHNNASFLPSGGNWGMYVTANGQVGSFLSGSTSAESFVMGKFGIGTNDPAYSCEIKASNPQLVLKDSRTGNSTTNAAYGSLQFRTGTDNGLMAQIQCYATGANSHYNGGLKFYTYYQGSARKIIDCRGDWVGIGLPEGTNPGSRLHVKQIADDDGGDWNHNNQAGILIERAGNTNKWGIGCNTYNDLAFCYNKQARGWVADNGSNPSFNFTGQHRTQMEENNEETLINITDYVGLIVSSTGTYIQQELGDYIIAGIDINEALPKIKLANQTKDKCVFGVVSRGEDLNSVDPRRIYQSGIFYSAYEKQSGDERIIVNSVGEGGIWVCDVNGALENGDYMTTTELAHGYGAKQDDDLLHNYTVAKITQNEDFSDMTNGKVLENGIKCKFVGCTYHCG